uniref:Uncharacterized protein n=1 Tax=Siphoviridae sp. ctBLh2 TaxID=2827803 RepID=A0A8S5S3G6_9CAUD|nr:MAG TPA: hypothetical protein [Siphoviridae sp. ctBLh2]
MDNANSEVICSRLQKRVVPCSTVRLSIIRKEAELSTLSTAIYILLLFYLNFKKE